VGGGVCVREVWEWWLEEEKKFCNETPDFQCAT